MKEQPDFRDGLQESIDRILAGSMCEKITRRTCASDNYDGVEYKLYGSYIPIRPIIDFIGEQDNFAIENMSFCNEGDEPHLIVFVADMRQAQDHPAFTPER